MQRYETRTSQIELAGGIRQATSDLITIAEPGSLFSSDTRKGQLYILAELVGAPSRGHDAGQLVTRTIRRSFYEDSTYSVTAALREAIRSANRALYKYNFDAPPHQRVYVGITCAVIKGDDLFVAQVAPAQAYIWLGSSLRPLPAPPAWNPAHLSVSPFSRGSAIGSSLSVEPELYRNQASPGTALLICSSNLAPLLSREQVERFLRSQDPAATVENLATLCEQQHCDAAHALVIEVTAALKAAARHPALGRITLRDHARFFWYNAGDWFGNVVVETGQLFRGRSAGSSEQQPRPVTEPDLQTAPVQPTHSPNPPPTPRPLNMGESIAERLERERLEREQKASRNQEALPPSAYMGEGFYQETMTPTGPRIDLSDVPATAARARPYKPAYELRPLVDLTWGERLALPFRRLGALLRGVRRTRPLRPNPRESMPRMRGQGLSYRRTRPPFPLLQLSLLGLLVALLILYGMNISQRSAQERALDYFEQADQRMAAVREANDDSQALERLEIARQAIEEVRASPLVTNTNAALWVRYKELEREYERALAAIQRQTFFEDATLLAQHPLPGGTFAALTVPVSTIVVTDTDSLQALNYIYALDGNSNIARLYRIPREGGPPEPYLSPNETVQTTLVGPLRAQTWRVDNIVAVDESPSGFGYYFRSGGQWNYTRLGGSEIWNPRGRLDMETYEGNLYVWGAGQQEILKFTSGRYSDPALPWIDREGLNGRDLSSAVDMAIDGNIYLLMPEGRILVLSSGRIIQEIEPEAITPPITAVTRFFVTGTTEEGWFFLIEPLNERVIQIDKTSGKVIQQIKMRPESILRFDQLNDIMVDTSRKPMIYLASGGQIVRASLPAPPRPFREEQSSPGSIP